MKAFPFPDFIVKNKNIPNSDPNKPDIVRTINNL